MQPSLHHIPPLRIVPPTLVRETPILPDLESLDCAEAVDRAVETFGLANVVRALRLVCAVNGRAL